MVKEAVAERRRQRREVFVPLTYRAGDLAEVDFLEVLVDVDGVRRKAWLFLLRLMYSGRDFAWIYERQGQVSFLDGHIRAFGCRSHQAEAAVLFARAADLVPQLLEARDGRELTSLPQRLLRVDVLIINEL
ncbi:MAG: hypothetical protein U0Q55_22120 [Vicinamibacterales bacterium]